MSLRVKVLQPPSCRKTKRWRPSPSSGANVSTGHPSADASTATDPITSLRYAAYLIAAAVGRRKLYSAAGYTW